MPIPFIKKPNQVRKNLKDFIISEKERLCCSYEELSAYIRKTRNIDIKFRSLNHWSSDDFKGRLTPQSVRLIAQWREESFEQTLEWLQCDPKNNVDQIPVIEEVPKQNTDITNLIESIEDLDKLTEIKQIVISRITQINNRVSIDFDNRLTQPNKNSVTEFMVNGLGTNINCLNTRVYNSNNVAVLYKTEEDVKSVSESDQYKVPIRLQKLLQISLQAHSTIIGVDYRFTPSILAIRLGYPEGSFSRIALNSALEGEASIFPNQPGFKIRESDWDVLARLCFRCTFIDTEPTLTTPFQSYRNGSELRAALISSLTRNHHNNHI